ncbi:hypothetical protein QUA71_28105 [Microcoleus sp. MON1_C5]|uniref:hypothetical protein n=1 Tax=Microcoleus sp. MON1_C5 TaxID=2818828 RepID=UPI002FD11B23
MSLKIMARFRDIMRADELKAQKNAYEAYLKLSTPEKQAAYAASMLGKRSNVGRQIGYIRPFGGPDNFYYETKVLAAPAKAPTPKEQTETSLINTVTTAIIAATGKHVVTAVPTGTNLVIKRARKIQFAKVKVIVPGSEVRENRSSRFTGKKYTQTEVNSVSCSFGRLDQNQNEQDAQTAIINALRSSLPNATILFTPQGFVG